MLRLMGIINLDKQSFSGDFVSEENDIRKKVVEFIENDFEFIDVGAHSTCPVAKLLSVEEECDLIRKNLPIILDLKKQYNSSIKISVDTFQSRVAELAISLGADIVNDISGGRFDTKMFEVVSKYPNKKYILTHSQGNFETMHDKYEYTDLLNEVKVYFAENIKKLTNLGFPQENIILDVGIGFSKKGEQNLVLINNLKQIMSNFDNDFLLGISRKSFLRQIFDTKLNQSLDIITAFVTTKISKKTNPIKLVHRIHSPFYIRQADTIAQ
jgi:dihydropteroate synthase